MQKKRRINFRWQNVEDFSILPVRRGEVHMTLLGWRLYYESTSYHYVLTPCNMAYFSALCTARQWWPRPGFAIVNTVDHVDSFALLSHACDYEKAVHLFGFTTLKRSSSIFIAPLPASPVEIDSEVTLVKVRLLYGVDAFKYQRLSWRYVKMYWVSYLGDESPFSV